MKEYKIIEARDTITLAKLVNEAIAEGWDFAGSLSNVHYIDQVTVYCQPMVKNG